MSPSATPSPKPNWGTPTHPVELPSSNTLPTFPNKLPPLRPQNPSSNPVRLPHVNPQSLPKRRPNALIQSTHSSRTIPMPTHMPMHPHATASPVNAPSSGDFETARDQRLASHPQSSSASKRRNSISNPTSTSFGPSPHHGGKGTPSSSNGRRVGEGGTRSPNPFSA